MKRRQGEYPAELRVGEAILRGMVHHPGYSPHPAVILYHGFTGNRMESKFLFVQFARRLAAEGWGCVRFDFSGCGESDGEFKEMTLGREIEEGKGQEAGEFFGGLRDQLLAMKRRPAKGRKK